MNATPEPTAAPPPAYPTGDVTFAFTDIEGSTRRWERHPAAMRAALRRHDALVRAAITAFDGVVFKTIGDAFCAAFRRPDSAIAAMVLVQRSLGAEDFSDVDGLHVRAAVHTGTADERDGDYFGAAVNRVARLLAVGHGGQILVSGATTALLANALDPETILLDLGEHRLKDLARPEHVYQVLAPDLPATFPPLRSLDALRNNLPLQLTTFVARDREVAEIASLLGAHRLVTLAGSGGIGKTRTSLQVAANVLDAYAGGVWFVELAPLESGAHIPSTVAAALGLTLASDGDPLEALARELDDMHTLLVFDNCEHLIEAVARVVGAMLRACPNVSVLASSRQALGIGGEFTYRMPSLEVPEPRAAVRVSASESAAYGAVALFVERARAVDRRFALTDENAAAVADVCRRLDGIPLAIELAAARTNILTPVQLRDRLDQRFRVLTGGSRDALPRQQTLRALIDWSHALLDERERAAFRRLSAFVNGFALEGAMAVACAEDLDELDAVDALGSLVDKSLVLLESNGDAPRYRLLESTREYAREKLIESGESAAVISRHGAYLRDRFVQARIEAERTARFTSLRDALASELEDVRAALRADDPVVVGKLLAEIGLSWRDVGLESEGISRIEACLAVLGSGDNVLAARLWTALSWLAYNLIRTQLALEAAVEAVARARATADRAVLAEALNAYARGLSQVRRFDEAGAALEEAEAIGDAPAARRLRLLQSRANLSRLRGDLATAAHAFEQIRDEHRVLGNGRGERTAALNLAETEHARGRTAHAVAIVRDLLPSVRAQADRTALLTALVNLAAYLAAVGEASAACEAAREALRELASRDAGTAYAAMALEHVALAFVQRGDAVRAATLAAYVDVALDRLGYEREFTETSTRERLTEALRSQLASGERDALAAEGAALSAEAAVALALRDP